MKRAAIVLLLWSTAARAEVAWVPPEPPVDPDRGNFWRELAEPHKDEITTILWKARMAMQASELTQMTDYDPTGEARTKLYTQLYGMLRYAKKLAPDNLEVLKMYAQVADTLGKTRQAMDALHAVIDLVGPEKAGVEVTGRLGELYLRIGELDEAVRYLRSAQGPIVQGVPITAYNLVHLSAALSMQGRMTEAIDVLADALSTQPPYYAPEFQVVAFALAVAYDRDDQRSLAIEQLDHLRAALAEQWGPSVRGSLAGMRFWPAEDLQYYRALLLEATDSYGDARAEWALYHGLYEQRALDHIGAIDKRPKTQAAPPRMVVPGSSILQPKLVPHITPRRRP